MRKMHSGSGGFAQYAGEYQLGEYFHKTLQLCMTYGRISHLWLTRLVIMESSSRAIGAIISPSGSKTPAPLTKAKYRFSIDFRCNCLS